MRRGTYRYIGKIVRNSSGGFGGYSNNRTELYEAENEEIKRKTMLFFESKVEGWMLNEILKDERIRIDYVKKEIIEQFNQEYIEDNYRFKFYDTNLESARVVAEITGGKLVWERPWCYVEYREANEEEYLDKKEEVLNILRDVKFKELVRTTTILIGFTSILVLVTNLL